LRIKARFDAGTGGRTRIFKKDITEKSRGITLEEAKKLGEAATRARIKEGFVTYALFGQSKQSVENKLASLGLGMKITTALIECLNWIIVPFTPCMKAGICNHQISLAEILDFRFLHPYPNADKQRFKAWCL